MSHENSQTIGVRAVKPGKAD